VFSQHYLDAKNQLPVNESSTAHQELGFFVKDLSQIRAQ